MFTSNHIAKLNSTKVQANFTNLPLFVLAISLMTLTLLVASPSANAQAVTVVEIGTGTVDSTRAAAPRWRRINFDPLVSDTHTIRVEWDSTADFRFSVNQVSTGARLATIDSATSPAEWTGSLVDTENYFLGVWSAGGGIANYIATIEAETNTALAINTQPVAVSAIEGDSVTFTVAAVGNGTLSYQWFVNNAAINGATTEILSINPATLADSNNVYRVDITDNNGTLSSDNATLVVYPAPPVTTITLGQGTLDSNSAVAPRFARINFDAIATALHTLTLSWDNNSDVRFNVFDDAGTKLNSSTIQGSNPGVWSGNLVARQGYSVRFWSTNGIANYSVNLDANVPITVQSQPSDLIVTEGSDAYFQVEASGSGILNYQWFANGNPILGETSDYLTVFAATLAENGTSYTVEISNGFDTIVSDVATLTVNAPVSLGLFSQEADTSTWMLDGPAPTLDWQEPIDGDAWGQKLLRVGDLLLVGGDFTGIKPNRAGAVTPRPFLAALNAVSGQPVSTFQVPAEVNSVVRALAISPDGNLVYVGGDFGFLALDATTGALDFTVSVTEGNELGRVFDIEVTQTHVYIGGDFLQVNNTYRANIARLSLQGVLDSSWSPNVTHGFETNRAAPVQTLAISPAGDVVYVGGNFRRIDGIHVDTTIGGANVSMLSLNVSDGAIRPERFAADIGTSHRNLRPHDIVATDSYVIIAWGGPNYLSFHALDGTRLRQYSGNGDIQALQVVGNHVFVGHHGEYFGRPNDGTVIPPEAVVSLVPRVILKHTLHSFRIDDPSFLPEQAFRTMGLFGVWGIAAAEDSLWIAGEIFRAGSNERAVEGLARFPALD